MNKKITGLCRFFIIFGLAFIILYPVIYMFSCSFRDSIDMNDPSVMWIPKHFTLDVIAETAEVMELPETLLNTFLINIGCSVVQVMACAVTGYGFARFDFFGKKFLFGIVIMMIIVPPQIISLPLYSNFVHLGLINSKLSMYLPALMGNGIRSGFMIFIFRQFFKGLPKEIEDSAYIDGCGRFRAFLSIMLPNAKSALLTVFLFSVVFYWNDYYISSLFFTDNQTVALMVKNLDSRLSVKLFNSSAVKASPREQIVWLEAGCLISVSPMLIMYTFLQRYFIEGIERSGIVG
ncbi:MAG TPA: carbohydrate ABC transporter permease [Ruminococcus sp.]|nr:carbohydrate ABC transporter permease [Ruminococcus sp.]